jgi:choline transport protein
LRRWPPCECAAASCSLGANRLITIRIYSSPTAGAQYHWVSQFAPASIQKPLSFCVGWFVVIAWQTGLAACSFTVGLQIEAIIVLADPSYVIKGWHSCLFTIAAALLGILFNTYLVRRLPTVEGIATILHIFGFFTFLVVFWVMGPRADAKQVFTSFQDNNGWGSVGLATLVGILSPISCLILGDSACHLSEELRDAGKVLPRSMIATAVVNYVFGFLMTVTLMFVVGDVQQAFDSPTGQPYVQTVLNTTGSIGATITLTAVIAILVQFSAINTVTSSSRQIFAFARDGGLPFSDFLSTVSPLFLPSSGLLAQSNGFYHCEQSKP